MTPRIHATAAALALAALPALSFAQATATDTGTGWTMPYQSGFWGHAGISLGGAQIDASCPSGDPCDQEDQAFRASAGGRFNNIFGGEIAYVNFGEFERGGGKTDADALDLTLMAGVPFANNWSVFGKLGAIYSNVDVSGDAPGLDTGGTNGWGWRAGVGLQMGLTQNWALRADLDRYELAVPGGGHDNVDTLLIGAQYTFR
jgi:OmpA-OmpF porin, OOP family